ncbi:cellulose biosynthesis protein BcsP [Caballeronia sp. INDeC2]|uniref:cellulose biosynthesis protein BcsP n=1 Tax=Caballeronia sp. INDeC2 TaxID=2921747 RepID=UPI002027A1DA|nr:cellulose biosynthesis protein BcsP [Caballeronia sp. INDeC2]
MNTSRDIEKLFDHFGGNAGDYQEIGRENEAKTARTRWPLLATLDFAQPAIPEIAPRREAQPNIARARSNEPSGEPADKPTPIHRGRQPLFTRPHRRTIPAVNPPAAESLSALRFSVLAEAASNETGTIADSTLAPVASVPPVQTPAAPVESKRLASDAGAAAPAAPPSILGKLFGQPAQHVPSSPAGSLDAVFERLRHARPQGDESTNTPASRHSRS